MAPTLSPTQPMPANDPHGEEWWTPERAKLHRWLRERAAHLAPIYLAALRMAMDESFPGRVHFVAHAIREIRNRLPHAVAGVEKRGPSYQVLTTKLRTKWEDEGLPSDGSLPLAEGLEPSVSGPGYEVSLGLLRAVADLVLANTRSSGNNRRQARRLFETIWGEPSPAYVINRWFHKESWVNKYMHVDDKPHVPEADTEVVDVFESFEAVLISISSRSYESLEALDEILASANQ